VAVLFQASSRQYNPNQRPEATLAVNPGATRITFTVTRGDWPEGPCLEYDILWSGVPDGATIVGGGVVRDKAGNPTGGTMQVTRTSNVRGGATEFTARVRFIQRLTGAILVEDDT
jgi:hypothetical protein